ncbi:TPA: hypothetical protein ACOEQV_000875 [Stenotrophomonas maltophilia]|uniref:hypothetical protein n=1 Tax=Stenotrophomonas maltophilia TaxID=40324 RepID=UPI0013DAA0D6|nr:hypothetical protein [Stenotrophomonas maltophilia]
MNAGQLPSSHSVLSIAEINSAAYRALDTVARALLLELRALDRPFEIPVITISVREAMLRLGVSQGPVERAFKSLLEHRWIHEARAGQGRRRLFMLQRPAIAPHGC